MMGFLRNLLPWGKAAEPVLPQLPAPDLIEVEGQLSLRIAEHFRHTHGLPVCDWDGVYDWLKAFPEKHAVEAWFASQRAWMFHFRDALGDGYRLEETDSAILVSALEPRLSRATLDFMERTASRITRALDGVARLPYGKDLLIVFREDDRYYEYASHYYPDEGEFAFSSGMHINRGCSHFITAQTDMRVVEPVIAHEMTHAFVTHLPLPAWLNEGIAVNMERRLCGAPPNTATPEQMRMKHLNFWGEDEVQEFWYGKSFLRTDDGNRLSYDLARILVEHYARDWEAFRAFVLAADRADAGNKAAEAHLGTTLGTSVAAILEKLDYHELEPDPECWGGEPEKGAFSANRLWLRAGADC